LIPALVCPTKHWVTKEATMEMLERPVPGITPPKTVERLLCPLGFQWAITKMEQKSLTLCKKEQRQR
jgi:hypothetical protein